MDDEALEGLGRVNTYLWVWDEMDASCAGVKMRMVRCFEGLDGWVVVGVYV